MILQPRSLQVVSLAIAESIDLDKVASDPAFTNMHQPTFIDEGTRVSIIEATGSVEYDYALHLVKQSQYTIDPSQVSEVRRMSGQKRKA